MTERKVLLLNQGYQPIATVTWQHALCSVFKSKADVVEAYADWSVNSASATFVVPAVLRLVKFSRAATRAVKFCRENVYMRDDYRCQYCGKAKATKYLTFDHVHPRSKGGRTVWDNIVTACTTCNNAKADRSLSESGMKLLSTPRVPDTSQMQRLMLRTIPVEWQPWLST